MALLEYLAEEVALEHAERLISRREALRRMASLGLSAAAAAALLAACGDDKKSSTTASAVSSLGGPETSGAAAATNGPTTTSASAAQPSTAVTFVGPRGQLSGSWAAASAPKGAVLIIHENRGLTDHFKALPSRFAADGYSALAIDLLSEEGGTDAVGADATAALGRAPAERLIADMRAGIDELARRVPGKGLAVVGFCFGGGMVWQLLAAGEPRLGAAAPFYGPSPAAPDFSKSKAAVLAIYGALDARVNGTREVAETALKKAGLTYEVRTFENADHAFFNDTGPRYNPTAANEAYAAVLQWFAEHLR